MRPIILSTSPKGDLKLRDAETDTLVDFDPSHPDAKLIAAAPELLEALELDLAFHSRPFVRDSIEEFRQAGYTGPAESAHMRAFLIGKKQQACRKARGQE